jgi:putative phage-type endonuclease
MTTTEWLIVDTETDGLADPIHVVEIAAQRMRGWEPVGEKFRMLLNHNVPIPSAAVAIHGYTQEFLRKNGEDPLRAHASFRDFAGNLPIVAHNLSFDWNRALYPEWARLGLRPVGQRGFCSLMLSRRLVDETKSYSMDALRRTFGISNNFSHRAFADVDSLTSLFGQVFRPRLEGVGVSTFPDLVRFSSRTPVAKCLCAVRSKASQIGRDQPAAPVDSWYFIDAHDQTHGPLPANEVLSFTAGAPCWVWREGLHDWESSQTSEAFLQAIRTPPPLPSKKKSRAKRSETRSVENLIDICNAVLADGSITTDEVVFLSRWLEEAGVVTEWPWTELAETVERIMVDGVVTDSERNELQALLQRVIAANRDSATAKPGRGLPTTHSVEIKIACDCGQHLALDSANGGQEFVCPACSRTLRVPKLTLVDPVPSTAASAPLPVPGCPTTKMELMCVGNAGSGYINAQIRVLWFELLVDEQHKKVDVIEHHLPIKGHRRENRVNYCEYEVPEGVICFYDRHVQTKPNVRECRFFRVENGQFQGMGDGAPCDFYTRFLNDYRGYDICSGSSRDDVEVNRKRRAELDKLGSGIHIFARGEPDRRDETVTRAEATPVNPLPLKSVVQLSPHSQAFTLVELTQGTPAWLEWRSAGIGASDAPAVMDENPWKTRAELLQQKCGWAPPTEVNYAMSRGSALEPEARQAYISRTGKWLQPACLQSTSYDWLRASVDGITSTLDAVVEIKCGRSAYRSTSDSGRVPDYYYAQLQHILAVTGLPSIDFWCYLPGLPELLVPVERNDLYIARLLETEYQFWTEVLRLSRGTSAP